MQCTAVESCDDCIYAAQRLQSPAEIVWLNGAPGSGKGTNTPFILESRGLSRAVTMCAAVLCSFWASLPCMCLGIRSVRG